MSFASPLFLLGLLLVPLAVAAYVAARRRSKRYAVRFTAAPTLKLAAGTIPAWRTHLPAAAALAALAVLTLALAKPERTVEVPSERATIMLDGALQFIVGVVVAIILVTVYGRVMGGRDRAVTAP